MQQINRQIIFSDFTFVETSNKIGETDLLVFLFIKLKTMSIEKKVVLSKKIPESQRTEIPKGIKGIKVDVVFVNISVETFLRYYHHSELGYVEGQQIVKQTEEQKNVDDVNDRQFVTMQNGKIPDCFYFDISKDDQKIDSDWEVIIKYHLC